MATSKITITLQNDQLEEIRRMVAAGRSPNVSAFIQHAVQIALSDAAEWKRMLEEGLEQTGGPVTKEERDWANMVLSGRPPKKAPRAPGSGKAA